MKNIIEEYQKSYSKTLEVLNANSDVLAVFVFGSIINGDLWEKSDIDMFVVLKEYEGKFTNVYSDNTGTYVHFKLIGKKEFLNLKEFDLQGSLIHRLFSSSKVAICRDDEIKNKYDKGRFYSDLNRKKWTTAYLSSLIKTLDSAEKAYTSGNYTSSYADCIEAMKYYAMVFLNSSGYLVSKNNISTAANFDQEFSDEFERLTGSTQIKKRCEKNIKFIKTKIDEKILEISELIFTFLREIDANVSSREAIKSDYFKDYPIDMEGIFETLCSKNLIKKSYRELYSPSGKLLMKENVYSL